MIHIITQTIHYFLSISLIAFIFIVGVMTLEVNFHLSLAKAITVMTLALIAIVMMAWEFKDIEKEKQNEPSSP